MNFPKKSFLTALFFTILFATVSSAATKEWTLAVFLNADNNLDRFGAADEVEMSKVGSNANLNIVTLIDREMGPAQINYIEKDKITKIKDMGELDMGDYKVFVNFVKFVKKNYPAKHYAFVFWNHGSGWKNKKEAASVCKGISYDDSTHNHISTNQLTTALSQAKEIIGKNIDVLCFDACLMQMIEVAYAVRDSVDYMVASEETEPGKGAPYTEILQGFKKNMTAKEFSVNWVNAYGDSYNGGSQGTALSTLSALDMSKLGKIVDAINGFAKSAMTKDYSRTFRQANVFVQKYAYPDNVDIVHFMQLVKEKVKGDIALVTAIDKVISSVKEAIVCNRWNTEKAKNSNGLAIWFPTSYLIPWVYKDLAFAKDSMWDEMLKRLGEYAFIERSLEEVRHGSMATLIKLVSDAKRDPKNPLYRMFLSKLNYLADVEKAIPADSLEQFEELRAKLKEVLQKKK